MTTPRQKPVLKELLQVGSPLAIAEITDWAESLRNKSWVDVPFPFSPYCIFERRQGSLAMLYDQAGIDWKVEQAGRLDSSLIAKNFADGYTDLREIIENEVTLERDQFESFVSKVKNVWIWFDGLYWSVEYQDRAGLDTSELMKTRKYTEYINPGTSGVIINTFKHLLPEYAEYADVLLIDEVLGGNIPSKTVLQGRQKVVAYAEGKVFNNLDEIVKEHDILIQEESALEGGDLKGRPAYPGKVTGRVRIVKTRDDMKGFNRGDVIVSPTTTPDFLPIMKVCSAIISEHGGVICHASITSRELKIPCVVGVRGATRILQNGDLIEVDANNGIVRIIEKK